MILVLAYQYYMIYSNKPQTTKLPDNSISQKNIYKDVLWNLDLKYQFDDKTIKILNNYMDSCDIDNLLIFRIKEYSCSPCKQYFKDLIINSQNSIGSMVMVLTFFENERLTKLFNSEELPSVYCINANNMISDFDRFSDPYIFKYSKNGLCSRFFIPEKNNYSFNKYMIGTILKDG